MKSARIEAFESMAAGDPVAATEALRSDLRASRGPLIEQLDAERVLVTFVWVGDVGPVSVKTQLVPSDPVVTSHRMHRAPGTDVWYLTTPARADVATLYQYVVDDPFVRPDGPRSEDLMRDYDETMRLFKESLFRSYADPYSDERLLPWTAVTEGLDDLSEGHWESVLRLARAEASPWFERGEQSGASLDELTLESNALGNTRTVSVFTPPSYARDAEPYPLVVFLDGEETRRIGALDVALQNLIKAGELRPVVAAFVHNASRTSRLVEMACEDRLVTMLADELVPILRSEYNVAVDPRRVVLAGASYGGLASAYTAFHRPDTFGNVLSCSGSHWWGCTDSNSVRYSFGRDGEPEWLTRQFANAELKPVRFWVDVGSLESGALPQAPGVDHRAANRHFRSVLAARGYDVTYHEAAGGHEFVTFRESMVKGLQSLLRGGVGAEVGIT